MSPSKVTVWFCSGSLQGCFVLLLDKFGYVWGITRDSFHLAIKCWMHKAIASRKAARKLQVRRKLMTLRLWWDSGMGPIGIRSWKRQKKRRLQAERGISCWNMGGAVLSDVEANIIMATWVDDDMKWVLRSLGRRCWGTQRPECQKAS